LTGNALLMPYMLNFHTYYRTPAFHWQHAGGPIHYNNQQFHDYYNGWSQDRYNGGVRDLERVSREKVRLLTAVFLWPGAFQALFCLPVAVRDRRMRLVFVELVFCLAGIFSVVYSMPHYAAPGSVLIWPPRKDRL